MTLDEFLKALERTPRDWSLAYAVDGRRRLIRRWDIGFSYQCPLTALQDQGHGGLVRAGTTVTRRARGGETYAAKL